MRKIALTEPTATWWIEWCTRCAAATDDLIRHVRDGGSITISEKLYKDHKYEYLMDPDGPFRRKCAYCERDLSSQHGDVEHFRPKKSTTDENDRRISRIVDGEEQQHPGYYWLAYDWTTLLPSCQICNVGNSQMSSGEKPGKRNRFPLCDEGARGWEPLLESGESPLLLNPVVDDPSDHLVFDSSGVIGWRSPIGETTVIVLGLNDYGMPTDRASRYKEVKNRVKALARKKFDGVEDLVELAEIERIKEGYGNFTAFARRKRSQRFPATQSPAASGRVGFGIGG